MRKSNYLVLGAAAVVAALLLVLWYHLGFNHIDSPLDLTLAIVWWVGIVAIAAIIVRFEERRRRQIRTLYVSPKSLYSSELGMVGIGDAGAVEAVVCALALSDGFLPGSPGTQNVDPAMRLDYLLQGKAATVRHALSNSFGFGGSNCSLILGVAP